MTAIPNQRPVPRLMAVAQIGALGSPRELSRWCEDLGKARVDAVQIRDKQATDRELYEHCARVREALPASIRLFVNARPDIATAVDADGVHLPANGLPTAAVRASFPDLEVGRSTHAPDEVEHAAQAGADYVFFGPVFPTPAKMRFGPPQGLERLARAAGFGIPVLAIGGIDSQNLASALQAGAWGVAAIRMFRDPAQVAQLPGNLPDAAPVTPGSPAHA